jgi:hypothetical protein
MADNINTRCVLIEIYNNLDKDSFRCLCYLAKDIIKNRKLKDLGGSLDLFSALKEKGVINIASQDFSLLEEMFGLMRRNDIVSLLTRCKQDNNTTERREIMTDKRFVNIVNIGRNKIFHVYFYR